MEPDRFYVTREEFEQEFGLKPDPSVIGMCFTDINRRYVLAEYIFIERCEECGATLSTSVCPGLFPLGKAFSPYCIECGMKRQRDLYELDRIFQL